MLTVTAIVGEATENDIAIGEPMAAAAASSPLPASPATLLFPMWAINPFDFLAQLLPELQKVPWAATDCSAAPLCPAPASPPLRRAPISSPMRSCSMWTTARAGTIPRRKSSRKLEAAIANCHVDGVTAKAELLYFPLTTYTGVEGRGYQGENPFVASADADYIQKVKAAIEDAVGRKIQTKPWPSPPTPATMPSRASSVWAILRQRSSCAITPGTALTLP